MILCCGEALIDMVQEEGQAHFTPFVGGAVYNTAIALGRLGTKVHFYNDLAADMFGDMLRKGLDDAQVNHTLCAASDRPCTLAFAKIQNGQARYTFYDDQSAGRMTGKLGIPPMPKGLSAAFFGGISLTSGASAQTYENLASSLAAEIPVMLDPNIRASFIKDAADYRARLARMQAHCDILKLSDEDLAWLLPEHKSLSDAAAHLLSKGPKLIVVTQGSKAVFAFRTGQPAIEIAPPQTEVADTIGAGDTLNAGLLFALDKTGSLGKAALSALPSDTLAQALRFACRAAAITVSRKGANPPYLNEIA